MNRDINKWTDNLNEQTNAQKMALFANKHKAFHVSKNNIEKTILYSVINIL